jgi:hypothetical protein
VIQRPGHDVKLTTHLNSQLMFEFLLSAVLPVFKDILWTAAAALLAYALNKLQTHFNNAL